MLCSQSKSELDSSHHVSQPKTETWREVVDSVLGCSFANTLFVFMLTWFFGHHLNWHYKNYISHTPISTSPLFLNVQIDETQHIGKAVDCSEVALKWCLQDVFFPKCFFASITPCSRILFWYPKGEELRHEDYSFFREEEEKKETYTVQYTDNTANDTTKSENNILIDDEQMIHAQKTIHVYLSHADVTRQRGFRWGHRASSGWMGK